MAHLNKIILILILSFYSFTSASADDWNDVTYFKRVDFKMRVIKHDPPIVLEWGKLAGGGELPDKLKPIAAKTYFSVMNMDYNDWKTYFTSEYINTLKMTKDKFENKRKIRLKDYPDYRFKNILYEIDYMFDGKEYSMVATYIGPEKITEWPQNRKTGVATLLIKEDGKWKGHDFDFKKIPYDGIFQFADFHNLTRIIETGFVYKSKKEAGVLPFEPCKDLKTDSTK